MSHLTLDGGTGTTAEKKVIEGSSRRSRKREQSLLLTMQMPTILCLSIEFIASFLATLLDSPKTPSFQENRPNSTVFLTFAAQVLALS